MRRRPVRLGYVSLVVTPETIRPGDIVWIEGREIIVTDMRAVGGRRDAVTLILPGGQARLMGPGDTLDALRPVELPAQPERAR
ncbi:hypothetical protein [Streptomyces sp. 6N223]|uniref:hypothetical protein n=1 Tax=Streptomyces sp. 6N223 TaxID=3457412 RepID=UPI003FD5AFE0